MDIDELKFNREWLEICDNNNYKPESKMCINCLYCIECLYEYEFGYECIREHFLFYPDEGIPEKPCLKNNVE